MLTTGAVVSECGTYRYRLWRYWGPSEPLIFIMLNPSVADDKADDPTIRKCIGFAKRLGYGGIEVYNLFAYRTTDPINLRDAGFPIGPDNDRHLRLAADLSTVYGCPIVCAWGAHARGRPRVHDVMRLFRNAAVRLYALKTLSDGTPAHPLMLPYTCRLNPI